MRLRFWAGLLLLACLSFSPVMVWAAPENGDVKITGMRWSHSADAVTGLIKVRLMIETSAPVEMDHFLTAVPNWRLVVTLSGVSAENLKIPSPPDTSVVTKMSVIKSPKNITHVVLDFPGALTQNQYKISSLPADPKAKSPFRIVIDVQKTVPPGQMKYLAGLRGKLVVIDPGHGGSDPGAIGVRGTREKQLNLNMAMQLKAIVEKSGAKVLMTRDNDIDVSGPNATDRDELQARTSVANNNKADIFISIHHNSSANSDRSGTGTYYYLKTAFDVMLARSIQEAMLPAGGLVDYGVRQANFYVIKNVTMPAVLLEIGFMSNPQEEQTLINPAFQQKIAQAIVTGIDQFFTQAAKMRGEQ